MRIIYISNLWINFKKCNIHILGVPEEEKEQEIENLFEKIMEETLPNLVKEIDMQVQEAQRILIMMDAKRPTLRHIIIKMPKVEDKEALKSSKRKEVSYLQGSSHKTVSWFLKRNFVDQKELVRNIQSYEKQGTTARIALPSKTII